MKSLLLVFTVALGGCASWSESSTSPATRAGAFVPRPAAFPVPLAARPSDTITIIDTDRIRRLRRQAPVESLSLTGGAKIGLWFGVGAVTLLLLDELTDEVTSLVECIVPFPEQCRED